jgi:hypothetical protein
MVGILQRQSIIPVWVDVAECKVNCLARSHKVNRLRAQLFDAGTGLFHREKQGKQLSVITAKILVLSSTEDVGGPWKPNDSTVTEFYFELARSTLVWVTNVTEKT